MTYDDYKLATPPEYSREGDQAPPSKWDPAFPAWEREREEESMRTHEGKYLSRLESACRAYMPHTSDVEKMRCDQVADYVCQCTRGVRDTRAMESIVQYVCEHTHLSHLSIGEKWSFAVALHNIVYDWRKL